MTKPNSPLYGPDLAHVHVQGYGFHWEGAAESILGWFEELGVSRGDTVVDLGCGGGQWLRRLAQEGFETCGVDVSHAMIRIARQNSPKSRFICGSFDKVALPACQAATSLGEPLNYLNSGPAMRRTMRNVYAALRPGGVFVFDVRHPTDRTPKVRDHHRTAQDWFCHARIEENPVKRSLIRYITTFRRLRNDNYRRNEEVHRLKIFPRAEVAKWLRNIGFRVRTKRGYGAYQLGNCQSVFICRKPG